MQSRSRVFILYQKYHTEVLSGNAASENPANDVVWSTGFVGSESGDLPFYLAGSKNGTGRWCGMQWVKVLQWSWREMGIAIHPLTCWCLLGDSWRIRKGCQSYGCTERGEDGHVIWWGGEQSSSSQKGVNRGNDGGWGPKHTIWAHSGGGCVRPIEE